MGKVPKIGRRRQNREKEPREGERTQKRGKGPKVGGEYPKSADKGCHLMLLGVTGCCGVSLPVPGWMQMLSSRSSHGNILRDMKRL